MNPDDSQLDSLILDLLDGSISPSDHVTLQQTLKSDPAARTRYQQLTEIHNLLEIEAEHQHPTLKAEVLPMEKIVSRQRWRFAKRSLIAAAALILISALVLQVTLLDRPIPQSAETKFADYTSFKITQPANSKIPPNSTQMEPGSKLEIHQGSAEITFSSGVKAIVQAPAKLTLDQQLHVELESGIAWFQVPPEAVGFTVTSSQIKVVDLGTQFGVLAQPNTMHEVHVFKGKVKAQCLYGNKQTTTLTDGHAKRTNVTGNLLDTPLNHHAFLDSLPDGLTYLRWQLDGSPTPATEGNISRSQTITSKITGKTKKIMSPHGSATHFSPNGGHMLTNWPGIGADRPRTISAWIKIPPHTPKHDNAIAEWGITTPNADTTKWRVNINPASNKRGALRTEFGQGYVIGTTDLRDGKWHHITSVYDGSGYGSRDTIKLYVNGKPEPISQAKPNIIRTNLSSAHSTTCRVGKNFHGAIKDLYIFSGVLPPEAIAKQATQHLPN
ncbi:LamG-like jellyroll fold domain-containing protein [Rubritalea tangerina]|uniref:LamG-like jellyroll fold domain-containing protein n=1 Tax=Rubritalea tangerina TaxID=430798 RepID=A0ABW4ZBK8_9BACT